MSDFPPWIERLLRLVGLSPTWVRWRLRYWAEWWEEKTGRSRAGDKAGPPRYKWCRHCGQMALAPEKTCACGKPLPSYAASQINRYLAIHLPGLSIVSTVFLGAIVFFFAAQLALFGLSSLLSPTTEAFVVFGGFYGAALGAGEYWRALTMALLHIGVIHLLFNVVAISQMLPRFEAEIGLWRSLLVITATQIGAAAGHLVWYAPVVPTAGASGVAFGLIGFGIAYCHARGLLHERRFYTQWLIYGVVFGLLIPYINNAAHAGGLLVGLPLGRLFGRRLSGPINTILDRLGMGCLVAWAICVLYLMRSIIAGA